MQSKWQSPRKNRRCFLQAVRNSRGKFIHLINLPSFLELIKRHMEFVESAEITRPWWKRVQNFPSLYLPHPARKGPKQRTPAAKFHYIGQQMSRTTASYLRWNWPAKEASSKLFQSISRWRGRHVKCWFVQRFCRRSLKTYWLIGGLCFYSHLVTAKKYWPFRFFPIRD